MLYIVHLEKLFSSSTRIIGNWYPDTPLARQLTCYQSDRKLVVNLQNENNKTRLFCEKRKLLILSHKFGFRMKKLIFVQSMPVRVKDIIRHKESHINY